MRLNSFKAFSLLELLVVIALLGIVSIVAVPNVKDWLVKREMDKDMQSIVGMVNEIGNNLGNGTYLMGGIFLNNNNGNGLIVNIRYRGPDKYQQYKTTCNDTTSEWDGVETYSSSHTAELYSTFSNIKMKSAAKGMCFDKNFTIDRAGTEEFCHKDKNSSSNCVQVIGNDPYYRIDVKRTSAIILERYIYATNTWQKQ